MLRSHSKVVDPDALRTDIERSAELTELQAHPALLTALSKRERDAERALAEWERDEDRRGRRRRLKNAKKAELREQRTTAKLMSAEQRDHRWFQEALSARRRASSPDAQLARVFRGNTLTARTLYGVVLFGMIWAAINVQGNLVPDRDPANPLFWLSFGIEAMFSVPLVLIMIHAQIASELGEETDRGWIALLEVLLLSGSIGLNAGPHYYAGEVGRGLEYSAAPVMIGVAIWLHAWLSKRNARLVSKVLARIAQADTTGARVGLAPDSLAASSKGPALTAALTVRDSHNAFADMAVELAPSDDPRTATGSAPASTDSREIAATDAGPHASCAGSAPTVPRNADSDRAPVPGCAESDTPVASSADRAETQMELERAMTEIQQVRRTSRWLPRVTNDDNPAPAPAGGGAATGAADHPSTDTHATAAAPTFAANNSAPQYISPALATDHGGASHSPLAQATGGVESALAGASSEGPAPRSSDVRASRTQTAAVVRALPITCTEDIHDEFDRIAHRILAADLVKKKTPAQIATVLRMLDERRPHAEITRATATDYSGGIHHKTIKTIAAAAEQVKVPVRAVR
ncbi:hypothetical protein ACWDO0_28215 [Nocardia rhamnosiphila]